MRLRSGSAIVFRAFGLRTSWTLKCFPHCLHTVEKAVGGTACECPQCGQGTGIFSGWLAAIQVYRVMILPERQGQRPGLPGSGVLGISPPRCCGAVGETLFG